MQNSIVENITLKIKDKETALFCGAGISYHSGIPLANVLLKYILQVLEVEESNASRILNSNLPFESFIQTLASEEGINDILDIFSRGEANTNHKLIAYLIKLGYIKTVLTTNFDTLIEKALSRIGLEVGIDYYVFSSEKEFEKIKWDDNSIRIIKIHGCISNRDEIEITLDLVARQTINQGKSKVVKSFFSKNINKNILILGYSCSDSFDITPLIESVEKDKSNIFFIEHCFEDSSYRIENVKKKKEKNPFYNYEGIRIYYDTDSLTKELWDSLHIPNYEYQSVSINWKKNIDLWISKAIEYSEGIKKQLVARLFYDIGEYNIAIENWEQGLIIAQKEGNQTFFYAQLGNLGMALNAIGKFNEAKKCLEESSKACKDIGNIQGEVSQLQALGNIYRNLREFDKAIQSFKRAVNLAETYERRSLCSSLGNLATVYNQTENYNEAISVLEKGLTIALSTGNKQSEGSILTSLGIAFFQKGDYYNATNSVLKSVEVTRQIGDRRGESLALHNLSNFSLQFNDFDNCIKYSTMSLAIAKEIKIRPSEANGYYNIGMAHFFKGEYENAVNILRSAVYIFEEIYGTSHSHTISATDALTMATKHLNSKPT